MSVGASREFDHELTMMVMACSHIVIINQKGEIHRQLRELLEVVLFAMKHLQVLRLKPDVLFALRDQSETDLDSGLLKDQFLDMDKLLTEHAQKFKINISDYLDLSPDALQPFPPAFLVKERKGRGLKTPVGAFSNTVLKLREKLFNCQESKFDAQSVMSKEFSTVEEWMIHARAVWNAIRKYGGNLVHYENMQEIEQRGEASNIFEDIVAGNIESGLFHDQCKGRLDDALNSQDQDVAKGTAGRILQKAVDELEAREGRKISGLLKDKLTRCKSPGHIREEFQTKLQRRVKEKKQGVLEVWASYETSVKEKVRSADLEKEMVASMRKQFAGGETADKKSKMEITFEREWQDKLGEVERELKASVLTDKAIQAKINSLFVEQVTDHQEREVYALLTTNVIGIPPDESLLLNTEDEIRWNKCLSRDRTATGGDDTRQSCIAECKRVMSQHFEGTKSEFENPEWKLDNIFMHKLMQNAVAMVTTLNGTLHGINTEFHVQVSVFANNVHDCLRARLYKQYRLRQDGRQRKKMDALKQLKDQVRERIMTHLTGMENDSSNAAYLAQDLRKAILHEWLEKKAALFQKEVDDCLRKKMGTAREATNHAFDWSFLAMDWNAVVSYCRSPTKFLESVFQKRFQQFSDDDKGKELTKLRSTLWKELDAFDTLVDSWGRAQASSDGVTVTTTSLKQYCETQSSYASSHDLKLADFMKREYTVANPTVFARAYSDARQTHLDHKTLDQEADSLLQEKLKTVRSNVWDTAKGCPETCPLCRAKCSLERDHLPRKHECEIHLYRAFGGWRKSDDNTPRFEVCTSKHSTEVSTFRDPNGTSRKLRDLYRLFHPDWKVQDVIPLLDQERHQVRLQTAWVNTRAVFLREYNMTDNTDPKWIELYENNPLT